MNKKLQVFISSTYIDLQEERQAAVQAVLDAGHIPAGMELFKAGNKSQLETIYKWIDSSDVYMLILGGRYGSIDEKTGKSYTHLEYEYAKQKDIPLFAVVLEDSYLDKKVNDLGEDESKEQLNRRKYEEFKEIVLSKIVRKVEDTKDIVITVHTTLKEFMDEYEMVGWTRADSTVLNSDFLIQINKLNEENQVLKNDLEKMKKEIDIYQKNFNKELIFEGKFVNIKAKYNQKQGTTLMQRNIQKEILWRDIFLLWGPYLTSPQNIVKSKRLLEKSLKDRFNNYVEIDDHIFHRIVIHLKCLGLIKKFEAKSTAGGLAEFVKITKDGEKYLEKNLTFRK
ncbi:DUF4062 domain-containing protein [Mammaliicoccus sciuri]|uniref:DUF4062 domain-containing protein n=1 Tax=Mammaliicoccus sciuri TaxID=1296 RepID=UPI0030CCF619